MKFRLKSGASAKRTLDRTLRRVLNRHPYLVTPKRPASSLPGSQFMPMAVQSAMIWRARRWLHTDPYSKVSGPDCAFGKSGYSLYLDPIRKGFTYAKGPKQVVGPALRRGPRARDAQRRDRNSENRFPVSGLAHPLRSARWDSSPYHPFRTPSN